MAMTIKELKEELKALNEERAKVDAKIKANEAMIAAYAPKRVGSDNRQTALAFDFRSAARDIFEANGNTPIQAKEIIERIVLAHPELTKQQIKSKLVYAVRPAAKTLVKQGYGKYIHADLIEAGTGISEPSA